MGMVTPAIADLNQTISVGKNDGWSGGRIVHFCELNFIFLQKESNGFLGDTKHAKTAAKTTGFLCLFALKG